MRVLLVGRFQPFHLGHLELLQEASILGEVLIAVGSSNREGTKKNPLSYEEREQCIERVLKSEKMKARIFAVPDYGDDDAWTRELLKRAGEFDMVMTGNPLVKRLMERAGKSVLTPKFRRKAEFNGTRVRRLIREGGDWGELVPKAVSDFLKEKGVVERIGGRSDEDRSRGRG